MSSTDIISVIDCIEQIRERLNRDFEFTFNTKPDEEIKGEFTLTLFMKAPVEVNGGPGSVEVDRVITATERKEMPPNGFQSLLTVMYISIFESFSKGDIH